MNKQYDQERISIEIAKKLLKEYYNISGELKVLPGELDFNFYIRANDKKEYVFKVSRTNEKLEYLDFQEKLLKYVEAQNEDVLVPRVINGRGGTGIISVIDSNGNNRFIRLLTWINGRVWSTVNPQKDDLRYSLGKKCAELLETLQGFDHHYARRKFDWDNAQWEWTKEHIELFNENEKKVIYFFHGKYEKIKERFLKLRKSVIHNDANDNNIVVSEELLNPEVRSLIDYGDAIYSQVINDLANTSAYAIMNHPDPLSALYPIVKGYNEIYVLEDDELYCLYTLIAIRLIISVTKSAINKKKEPDNTYLQISEKPAWNLLNKWIEIPEDLVYYSVRIACSKMAHPDEEKFKNWALRQEPVIKYLIPECHFKKCRSIDMSIGSTFLGNFSDYNDMDLSSYKIKQLKKNEVNTLFLGGYLEHRPFYSTDSFKRESNNGYEYRTCHLGIDLWLDQGTPVHSPVDGVVYSLMNNSSLGDYGPTVILEHKVDDSLTFYSLYGHMNKQTLKDLKVGQKLKQGDKLGLIGSEIENGGWVPHLHFQLIMDLLGEEGNFPGVAYPDEIELWKSLSPDPNLLLQIEELAIEDEEVDKTLIEYRKTHLGKSLSLSYKKPLKILRGEMQYLIDEKGQKYLDTVNNVAHVGHENPRVVNAARKQLGVLNTNSRYLHPNINDFAKELLETLPNKLSVLHFVNSGSEANELAMRMAKAHTGEKDMLAVEIGYHGNTGGCISISSYKFDGKGGKGKPENTHIVPLPDHFRGKYTGENTGVKYAKHIESEINKIESEGRNISAFICEGIISCGGQIVLPDNYLKTAFDYVRSSGGLCIVDEVQTGFGRVGKSFWAFELQGVIPDIVTMGKPIGNGHPLAAVACTQEVAESFANGMEYFNTFGGNPVSSAIGREVLRVIKDEKLQKHALELGNYLKKSLKKLKEEFPIIGDVRGEGLFLGFEIVDQNKEPLAEQADYLANRMKEHKILMSTDGPDNNVLKIKPPLVFTKENADELIARLEHVFKEDFMKEVR